MEAASLLLRRPSRRRGWRGSGSVCRSCIGAGAVYPLEGDGEEREEREEKADPPTRPPDTASAAWWGAAAASSAPARRSARAGFLSTASVSRRDRLSTSSSGAGRRLGGDEAGGWLWVGAEAREASVGWEGRRTEVVQATRQKRNLILREGSQVEYSKMRAQSRSYSDTFPLH
ncbi:hypothetical protein ZWY2020_049767 [Hordeum vulgare]|nr:hypothetical protein ZWY2020_049767 [Hordeum vulgare]